VRLADLIDWQRVSAALSESFVSKRGRPATSPRLIAGLLYLQHAFDLSDEEVVWHWVENPYWQVFTGQTYLQLEPPIDPSSLTRWRKRLGEAGVEELLAETIEAAKRADVIKPSSIKRVIVDTTVMQKAIAHPTDSRLLERCREHLVKAAARHGLKLRQNYNREAPRLAGQIGRYAHAKQYKRMRRVRRGHPLGRLTIATPARAPTLHLKSYEKYNSILLSARVGRLRQTAGKTYPGRHTALTAAFQPRL